MSRDLDYDTPETIDGIAKTLEGLGHKVVKIEADERIFDKLAKLKGKIDVVFNISEGLWGDARESWVPMACEILEIPYTHSTPTVLALCLDKRLCKLAVAGLGIRVPKENRFPALIKPVSEGSSIGIFDANVVKDEAEMIKQVGKLRHDGMNTEFMVEEYIDGREFTVGVLGNEENLEVLPIVEQKFDILPPQMHKIAGFEMKWKFETDLKSVFEVVECPAKIPLRKKLEIENICRRIYTSLGIRDCARIDLRMRANGQIFFLEVNPLPGLIPNENILSYFPLASRVGGFKYAKILEIILFRAGKQAFNSKKKLTKSK